MEFNMKRLLYTLLLCLPLFGLFGVLGGCAGSSGNAAEEMKTQTPLSEADLIGHTFSLGSINGTEFRSELRTPELRFGEGMRVSGRVCNSFSGPGTLKDGMLTVPQAASTMMLCPDQALNQLENDLYEMFRLGAKLAYDAQSGKLTLSRGELSLEYRLNDQAE